MSDPYDPIKCAVDTQQITTNLPSRPSGGPEEYAKDELDTNGVEQDHVETFWPPEHDPKN